MLLALRTYTRKVPTECEGHLELKVTQVIPLREEEFPEQKRVCWGIQANRQHETIHDQKDDSEPGVQ